MDDYNITSLQESTNEWVSRLTGILTPCIIQGCKTLYHEAFKLCLENDEEEKYLMTFQNFLSRIPKWNNDIVEKEVERIKSTSGCDYLEDLITCVHVIQLKALTCIRVGMKHKTIDIDIPKLGQFVHKVYIQLARKLYTNVYLFEEHIPPLQIQRNNRELEVLTKECILEAVRESVPVESILKAYLDETVEENVETMVTTVKEERKEVVSETAPDIDTDHVSETAQVGGATTSETDDVELTTHTTETHPVSLVVNEPETEVQTHMTLGETEVPLNTQPDIPSPVKQLTFSNIDQAQNEDKSVANVLAPKDIPTLERKSDENHLRRMLEEADDEDDDDEDNERITIMDSTDANISLDVETL